jgi:hypothetical protein
VTVVGVCCTFPTPGLANAPNSAPDVGTTNVCAAPAGAVATTDAATPASRQPTITKNRVKTRRS